MAVPGPTEPATAEQRTVARAILAFAAMTWAFGLSCTKVSRGNALHQKARSLFLEGTEASEALVLATNRLMHGALDYHRYREATGRRAPPKVAAFISWLEAQKYNKSPYSRPAVASAIVYQ